MSPRARSQRGGFALIRSRIVPLLVVAAVAAPALAGCLEPAFLEPQPPPSDDSPGDPADAPPTEGEMTASESVTASEGTVSGIPGFFAERVVTVGGVMRLDALPVVLRTFDGAVTVSGASGEAWRLVATLRASGLTPVDARENLEGIEYSWAHERGGGHYLEAVASVDALPDAVASAGGRSASLTLEVPARVLVGLSLDSGDGDVRALGLRASGIAIRTSDGDVDFSGVAAGSVTVATSDGDVSLKGSAFSGAADLETTNGDVSLRGVALDAVRMRSGDGDLSSTALEAGDVRAESASGDASIRVVPTRSGSVVVASEDGDVVVRVPAGSRFGYDVRAASADDDAAVRLSDGDSWPDGESARFRTNRFDDRAVQVRIDARSGDGDVVVRHG